MHEWFLLTPVSRAVFGISDQVSLWRAKINFANKAYLMQNVTELSLFWEGEVCVWKDRNYPVSWHFLLTRSFFFSFFFNLCFFPRSFSISFPLSFFNSLSLSPPSLALSLSPSLSLSLPPPPSLSLSLSPSLSLLLLLERLGYFPSFRFFLLLSFQNVFLLPSLPSSLLCYFAFKPHQFVSISIRLRPARIQSHEWNPILETGVADNAQSLYILQP